MINIKTYYIVDYYYRNEYGSINGYGKTLYVSPYSYFSPTTFTSYMNRDKKYTYITLCLQKISEEEYKHEYKLWD